MPTNETMRKTLEQVVHETGRYPLEAFEFVRHGLTYTVEQIHGDRRHAAAKGRSGGGIGPEREEPFDEKSFHVSGQQLS